MATLHTLIENQPSYLQSGVISRGGGASLVKSLAHCGCAQPLLNFCTTDAFQSALSLPPMLCIVLL